MKIIEKIEIHRFRSISDVSIETNEIIIFSGINNSGKSNILKALNLFFNKNSSFGQKYDFDKDYNKAHTGQAGGKREIKITLYFAGQGNAALKKPFFISKTFEMGREDPNTEYHSTDQKVQKSIADKDGNITRQFTRFLNKIEFFYVPAVRDKNFVRSLFLHFEKLIEHNSGDDFKTKMDDLSNVLQENSIEISKDFEKFIGLPTQANLSSKITDILSTVEINVKTGIKVLRRTKRKTNLKDAYVDLFSSGDGILMSYLAYFLAHVCRKISNKNFIWGFEEPENSLEYSKVQKIAEEFNNEFKKNAQIFITTHSPAFIELKDQKDVNFFRVYIKPEDSRQNSEIKTLNDIRSRQQALFNLGQVESSEYKKLQEELYFVEFAKEIKAAVERVRIEEKLLLETRREFETKNKALLETQPGRIFICEDKDNKVIKLWKKLFEMFNITDIVVMSSEGSTKNFIEIGIRHQQKLNTAYNPKVFRQVDRDSLTDEQISSIENKVFINEKRDLKYEFKFLPVNEMENFAILSNTQNFTEVFWDTNKDDIMDVFQRTAESMLKKQ
ncbi:AAA family ATPase [Candidatus Azambacteria bacterium]|nr:AAA family ATPase [Candidatus Azambacteria bacterium]